MVTKNEPALMAHRSVLFDAYKIAWLVIGQPEWNVYKHKILNGCE